jgi:hypothetical protein
MNANLVSTAASAVSWLLVAAVAAAWGTACHAADDGAKKKGPPSWGAVRAAVDRSFAAKSDFERADLITREDVQAVLRSLEKLGWKVADAKNILADTLSAGDVLVTELSTTSGRAFMRKVSGYPIVYDRLDRISRMPGGARLLHDVTKLPDGHKYAQVKPTPGFTDLTSLLPNQASGKPPHDPDFNKPTGRIYTAQHLLDRLKASHAAAVAGQAAAGTSKNAGGPGIVTAK